MGHQAKVKRARRWILRMGKVNDDPPKRDHATFMQVAAKFAKRLQNCPVPRQT